jgi:hypothetical protein
MDAGDEELLRKLVCNALSSTGLILMSTGCVICIWTIFESGCGIQMSQATPTKFSMLFKHSYGKNF